MTFTDIPIFSIVTNGQVNDLIANLLLSNLEHFRVRSDDHGRLRCSFGASSVVRVEGHDNGAGAFQSVDRNKPRANTDSGSGAAWADDGRTDQSD